MIDRWIDDQIDALLEDGGGQTLGHPTFADTRTGEWASDPTPEQIASADLIAGMLDQDQDPRQGTVRTLCSRCLRPMHHNHPESRAAKPICVRCLIKALARRARREPPE